MNKNKDSQHSLLQWGEEDDGWYVNRESALISAVIP